MNTTTFHPQIRSFIVDNYFLGQEESRLNDGDSFLEHGILDSTGVLQLITFLEETYGIKVEDEDVSPENLDSIERVSAYLSRKMNGLANVSAVAETAAGASV